MVVVPLIGSAVVAGVSVMVDPVGARSGTRRHAAESKIANAPANKAIAIRKNRGARAIMKPHNILSGMKLGGQHRSTPLFRTASGAEGNSGYAMAVLLVAMGVMAILMTVAMPVWKQASQREKETELVFRGEQIAHAIGLYQRKAGPGTLPPNDHTNVDCRRN